MKRVSQSMPADPVPCLWWLPSGWACADVCAGARGWMRGVPEPRGLHGKGDTRRVGAGESGQGEFEGEGEGEEVGECPSSRGLSSPVTEAGMAPRVCSDATTGISSLDNADPRRSASERGVPVAPPALETPGAETATLMLGTGLGLGVEVGLEAEGYTMSNTHEKQQVK